MNDLASRIDQEFTQSVSFNAEQERQKFPLLSRLVHDKPLAYLDNAATTQKPQCVIDAISDYYQQSNANVHRGVHLLSQIATDQMEAARDTVQQFVNAAQREEIIFTKGTTEAINLIAHGFSRSLLKAGDEILISAMEHHSNIVPWQMACELSGSHLKVIPMNQDGELEPNAMKNSFSDRTRLLAITHVSNALGTVNPLKELIGIAHQHGVPVLVDGAQAVAHLEVDVQDLDCDFYAFSSHKLYGPCGVGALYGKREWLERLPPYQGGGDMIQTVSFEKSSYAELPYKFEAGTPAIADIIGMAAAIDYVKSLDFTQVYAHEQQLLHYCADELQRIEGVKIIGNAADKIALHSFVIDPIHPHDVGTILDAQGVAVRTGHHCAMPVMTFYEVPATVRASFSLYNTRQDVDQMINALLLVREMLG